MGGRVIRAPIKYKFRFVFCRVVDIILYSRFFGSREESAFLLYRSVLILVQKLCLNKRLLILPVLRLQLLQLLVNQ